MSSESRSCSPQADDASIVLVGLRGTGKSTLGVMAASALGYALVDSDRYFFQRTGLSRVAYKNTHGAEEYRRQEIEMTRSMLLEKPSKAIIVCGPGSVEGTGQRLLSEFARTHPVIFVDRETKEIQRCIGSCSLEVITNLVEQSGPVYRSISNLEFFNVDQRTVYDGNIPDEIPTSLVLKKVERDFLQFLSRVENRIIRTSVGLGSYGIRGGRLELDDFCYTLNLLISDTTRLMPKLCKTDLSVDAVSLILEAPSEVGEKAFGRVARSISKELYLLRRMFQLPVTLDIQLPITPSNWTWQNEALYCDLLQFALRLCPEILCVDLRLDDERITKLVQSKGSSKIMGHYYDPEPGPNGWCSQSRQRILRRAEELGCDIVRLCQPAKSANDNVSVQQVRAAREERGRSRVPLIAYNTGELGRMSCCFNPILTPVTHPVLRTYSSTASSDHLLTVAEAQNALFSSFVLDQMHFGIIGADIAWSLSPTMHNAAFKLLGMPHEYTLIQRSSLDDLDALAHDPHFGGASITMPFKQEIIPFLDTLSPEARAIGAVNTLAPVRLTASGSKLGRNRAGPVHALHGENTDWKGIITCIRRSLSPINAVKPLSTALVLGAGGMARAALFALVRLGVRNVFIYNRTREHAEAMARHFQGQTLITESRKQVHVQLGHDSGEAMAVDAETAEGLHCSLHILPSLEPWPEAFQSPSIIVSCVPGVAENGSSTDLTVPPDWLGSHNGGVLVEVCIYMNTVGIWI